MKEIVKKQTCYEMITKMYTVEGMMCDGCVHTVRSAIKGIPEIIEARVQLGAPQAIVSMHEDVPCERLQKAVSSAGKYSIREVAETGVFPPDKPARETGKARKLLGFLFPKKDCCQ